MMNTPEFPTVRRPFVLMVFAVLFFYLAVAMAQGQSLAPPDQPGVNYSFIRSHLSLFEQRTGQRISLCEWLRPDQSEVDEEIRTEAAGEAGDALADAASSADTANHPPVISKTPPLIRYYPAGAEYDEYFVVLDSDVVYKEDSITVQMNAPAGFTVDVSRINAWLYLVHVHAAKLPERHTRLRVTLLAKDLAGVQDLYNYEIYVSDPLLFGLELKIMDSDSPRQGRQSIQYLTFGMGTEETATTGFDAGSIGRFDTFYCEYELPPSAPARQFDARWEIPSTTGTLWNIYPELGYGEDTLPPWYFTVNARYDGYSEQLPVTITWSASAAAKAPRPLYLADRAGSLFRVDMRDGSGTAERGIKVTRNGDLITVTISLEGLNHFMIRQEYSSSVADDDEGERGEKITCVPNPTSGATEIRSTLPGALRAEIVDGRGVRVRTLRREAGAESFLWDGRDERGSECPSGIYHCHVVSASPTSTTSIVIVR